MWARVHLEPHLLSFLLLPHPGATAVLVDELDAEAAEKLHQPFSSCSCGNRAGLHKEIGRDLPTCIDLLDHL
jgi:hypothetical protein